MLILASAPVLLQAAEVSGGYAMPAGLQGLGKDTNRDTGSVLVSGRSAAQTGSMSSAQQTDATRPGQFLEQSQNGQTLQRVLQPPKPSEFQNLVSITTGQNLPIFGQDMFEGVPSTFAPLDGVPVTSDYVVGPGDELLVRGWGQVDIDVTSVVGRNGAIFIPKVGNLNVGGLRYEEVVPLIKSAVGRIYKNFDLTVSMGQLRSIQIFVVGQAKRPGSYTVSSLSTLVNALFASGGPSASGSMRAVQLKRQGKVVTTFDLYDLIISGDKSNDARLLPGDVVYIPPVGKQVAIHGSVNRAAVYEAKSDSTLKDLLNWAGGLSTAAAGQKVTVERITDRQARKVAEFQLNGGELASSLQDGDVVSVYAVSPRLENSVTLHGNVAQAMRFPWREGMRISDIIPDRNALIIPDYWVNRNRSGQSQSWLVGSPVTDSNQLIQASFSRPASSIQNNASKSTKGSLQEVLPRPTATQANSEEIPNQLAIGDMPDNRNMIGKYQSEDLASIGQANAKTGQSKFREELSRNNLEVNWDYAVIERQAKDLSTDLIPFNLGKAVLERDLAQDVLLQPGDTVTVFSKRDIVAPSEKQTRFVRLEGEIANAGVYRVQAGETLRQLVHRVGGLTNNAYLFGAELNRESARKLQEIKLQELADRLEQEVERSASQKASSAISAEAQASLKSDLEAQKALVAKLRNTPVTGRIVLEMPTDARGIELLPDLSLEDGDRLYVPARPGFVLVNGSVYSQNAYIYKPHKRLTDYVTQAGGATRTADEGDTFVIRADGSVHNGRNAGIFSGFRSTEIMPGDTIVVPEDFNKVSWMRELKDWSQIIYQFALGAAAFKSLNK
ncbi:SLBB domain-containing protein [Chitinimonas sp. PSY-7]|uniref:SLBB domain-containing protein n=1 Tax=Chitinimonas sp. PSY-7 TaxID=3459088 RepID=UPI0040400DFA